MPGDVETGQKPDPPEQAVRPAQHLWPLELHRLRSSGAPCTVYDPNVTGSPGLPGACAQSEPAMLGLDILAEGTTHREHQEERRWQPAVLAMNWGH